MFERLDIMRMAQAYATHAATRQQAIAQNVANADTPGYRAQDAISFAEFWRASEDGTLAGRATLAPDAHPASVAPDGNTVSIEYELMRAVSAREQHETALGIYSMARDLIRASIGK